MSQRMTLTEYLNQENPIRKPQVILQEGEFTVGATIPVRMLDNVTSIFIKAFPQYEYAVTNGAGTLYTTDSDGNRKKCSCFYIPSTLKVI